MKWRIFKAKGRWWLVKPKGWPMDFVAQHVGTYEECLEAFRALAR